MPIYFITVAEEVQAAAAAADAAAADAAAADAAAADGQGLDAEQAADLKPPKRPRGRPKKIRGKLGLI